ncbi:MAG: archaellin/type IV pilin N-terminal domain-containing protein [Desulfurococcaceae archaeon]
MKQSEKTPITTVGPKGINNRFKSSNTVAGRRAISPVIATVIIVAVTIAVAIAVAFWMTGIIGLFTGFEQLQIVSIYDDAEGIHLSVKNTGTQTATITDIAINGRPCSVITCIIEPNIPAQPLAVRSGDTVNIVIRNVDLENLGPGTSVEVKLLTASGKEYPKLIVLQGWQSRVGIHLRLGSPSGTYSSTQTNEGKYNVTIKVSLPVENIGTQSIKITVAIKDINGIPCNKENCTILDPKLPIELKPYEEKTIEITASIPFDEQPTNPLTVIIELKSDGQTIAWSTVYLTQENQNNQQSGNQNHAE